jgi:hypothetical protein
VSNDDHDSWYDMKRWWVMMPKLSHHSFLVDMVDVVWMMFPGHQLIIRIVNQLLSLVRMFGVVDVYMVIIVVVSYEEFDTFTRIIQ